MKEETTTQSRICSQCKKAVTGLVLSGPQYEECLFNMDAELHEKGYICQSCGTCVCEDCKAQSLKTSMWSGWKKTMCPACGQLFGPSQILVDERDNLAVDNALRDPADEETEKDSVNEDSTQPVENLTCDHCGKEVRAVRLDWDGLEHVSVPMISAMDELGIKHVAVLCTACGKYVCAKCFEDTRIHFSFAKLIDYKDPFFLLKWLWRSFSGSKGTCPNCKAKLKLPTVYKTDLDSPIVFNNPTSKDAKGLPVEYVSPAKGSLFYKRAQGLKTAHESGQAMCPYCGSTSITVGKFGIGSPESLLSGLLLAPLGLCGFCCGMGAVSGIKRATCIKCGNRWPIESA